MSSTLPHIQPGNWSLRCYRLLMKLYPQTFLAEFGDSIDQAFRDSLRDAFQTRGNWGVALLWLRIIPDFIFSVVELLTSTAGDYLKWYFRLRWVLACGLGLAVGQVAASSLVAAGVLDYLGLPRQWGLLGVPIWLSLGFLQSRVLTDRFCNRWQWTTLTCVGGVLGIIASRALQSALLIPTTFNPMTWEGWVFQIMIAGTTAAAGAAIGLFQWSALRDPSGGRLRWAVVCACAVNASALVSIGSVNLMWPLLGWQGSAFFEFLRTLIVGSVFGLITAVPLKRMLWPQSAEVSQSEPARDAEVS